MLKESKVLNQIAMNWVMEDDSFFHLFGGKCYTRCKYIAAPYKVAITNAQEAFNNRLSHFRMHVEYGFGKVVNLFPFTYYVKQNKLLLQPVPDIYLAATILANCHSCFFWQSDFKIFSMSAYDAGIILKKTMK